MAQLESVLKGVLQKVEGGFQVFSQKLIGGKTQQSTSNTTNGTENQLKSLIQKLDWKFEQALKQIPFSGDCA